MTLRPDRAAGGSRQLRWELEAGRKGGCRRAPFAGPSVRDAASTSGSDSDSSALANFEVDVICDVRVPSHQILGAADHLASSDRTAAVCGMSKRVSSRRDEESPPVSGSNRCTARTEVRVRQPHGRSRPEARLYVEVASDADLHTDTDERPDSGIATLVRGVRSQ